MTLLADHHAFDFRHIRGRHANQFNLCLVTTLQRHVPKLDPVIQALLNFDHANILGRQPAKSERALANRSRLCPAGGLGNMLGAVFAYDDYETSTTTKLSHAKPVTWTAYAELKAFSGVGSPLINYSFGPDGAGTGCHLVTLGGVSESRTERSA